MLLVKVIVIIFLVKVASRRNAFVACSKLLWPELALAGVVVKNASIREHLRAALHLMRAGQGRRFVRPPWLFFNRHHSQRNLQGVNSCNKLVKAAGFSMILENTPALEENTAFATLFAIILLVVLFMLLDDFDALRYEGALLG